MTNGYRNGHFAAYEKRDLIEVLDFSPGLYLVLSSAGDIVYANKAMRDWLARGSSGFCAQAVRLTAAEPERALQLKNWIASVFACEDVAMHFLALERADDPPLILRAHVFDHADAASDDEDVQPLAIVSVHDALAFRSLSELARLFELTSAERSLSELILSGASLSDAQAALRITANTARTHLKSIYRKTGAHTQADLVRLLKDVATISDANANRPWDPTRPQRS